MVNSSFSYLRKGGTIVMYDKLFGLQNIWQ
jgi:hypothetical protein